MNPLAELCKWYEAQCDLDWEHKYGIQITTLDNPGWSLKVDLADTDLESKAFERSVLNLDVQHDPETTEPWYECFVENQVFVGYGGPFQLEQMISIFLQFAKP